MKGLKSIFTKKKKNQSPFALEYFPDIGGVLASKMVTEGNHKPRFIFRDKPFNEADSGWRIFSGFETDEYTNNPNNLGFYHAKTISQIDDSIVKLLLFKGIGSAWEKKEEHSDWKEVLDYPLEADFITEQQITENWFLTINNLFIRKQENKDLMFTTGDRTLRFTIWNEKKSKEEIFNAKKQEIDNKKSKIDIINIYQFNENNISKIGYHTKEYDEQKKYEYHLIVGFSIVDNQIISSFFYFDHEKDLNWALETWKKIEYRNNE